MQPETKDKEAIDPKENKSSKNKDSETQTEATIIEKESNNCGKSGKEMFKHINCKYFYKGNGLQFMTVCIGIRGFELGSGVTRSPGLFFTY